MTKKRTEPSFRDRYVGPDGPHLNCLTETTRKGTYDEKLQQSIHPRVRMHGRKLNTCKPPRKYAKGIL